MHQNTINMIRRYADEGYSVGEIAELTGYRSVVVGAVLHHDPHRELRLTALQLLRRVPFWWQGTSNEWERVVRANFSDVLTT